MNARRKRNPPEGALSGRGRNTSRDPMERFHEEWLGMVQPIDGLVVSKPALIDAQVSRPDDKTLRDRFVAQLTTTDPATARIASLPAFLADILALGPERWIPGKSLPDTFRLAIPNSGQLLAPSQALVRESGSKPVALLWELPPGLPLDTRETVTGGWDYPPSAKFDRLLRHAGVPIGLVSNGTHMRLLYTPHGASTGALTFPIGPMATVTGRPVLDAFVMLLHSTRWFGVAPEKQLPALLAASREAQGRVTKVLADQVLEALQLLLAGFENAAGGAGGRSTDSALAAAYRDPDLGAGHVYAGLLTFMLRLVFVLYAEDNDLLPVEDDFYAENLSVLAQYEDLAADAGAYPDAMARRFGAYGRLLALFRAIYFGISHGTLRMPPRHGELFSPHAYLFLEGNREPSAPGPNDAEGRRRLDVPAIDDETVYLVLRRLLVLGEERLSYKALDVEQIGSVYENLMGFRVVELSADAVCLKKSRAWITGDDLASEVQGARARWLQAEAGLSKADADRTAHATAGIRKPDAILDALIEVGAAEPHSRTSAGRFVIQPGPERWRSGSHYTPRSLTAPIVERTLAPLLAALPQRTVKKGTTLAGEPPPGPSSEDLLSLKICDPAMGSGAFLVEAVRQLGDHVVAAWRREGKAGVLLPSHGPAHAAEDAVAQARRMVAQRCIYGVDKDPQAVTLAKLSLWLVTLAKHKPFSFLDHALRRGDSLVGIDIAQLTAFHWNAGKKGQQLDLIDREIREVLEEAVYARERIVALARDDSPEAHREKERLLEDAQDAVRRLRLIGDLMLGAFFSSTIEKQREAERLRRRDLVAAWLASGQDAPVELVELATEYRRRIPAFHWMIEFPEVFWVERPDPINSGKRGGKAWIDAFVGNPPFLGQSGISGSFGDEYRDWLFFLHPGSHGKSDLVAHFFRRVVFLLGEHGAIGLLATNTIAQGDTRESGLKLLVAAGLRIFDATRSMPWPGEAAVTVSVVHGAAGVLAKRTEASCLDGQPVSNINSRLRVGDERPDPVALRANADSYFMGSKIYGQGFVVTEDEATQFANDNGSNRQIIRPYLGGDEINSHPLQLPDRHVINFQERSLDEAGRWPQLLRLVRERVKPERDKVRDNADGEHLKKYWWRFFRPQPNLYRALSSLPRCLAASIHSKHWLLAFEPTDIVFSHATYVFPLPQAAHFALLQSRVHEFWARLLSSTMKADLRYSASDCFETFPFPTDVALVSLDALGENFYAARAYYTAHTWQGLTTTYNQLKDPDYSGELSPASAERPVSPDRSLPPWTSPAGLDAAVPAVIADPDLLQPETRVAYIRHLRHLHESLDRAVLAAYGWSDIAVPPYCPPSSKDRAAQGAVSFFEDTVIDRLFALNAQRAAKEKQVAQRGSTPLLSMTGGIKKAGTKKPKRADLTPQGQSAGGIGSSPTSRKNRGG